MDFDEYIPDRIQELRGNIWTELTIAIIISVAIVGYLYFILFRTTDLFQGVSTESVVSIVSIAYSSGPIYTKVLIGLFSLVFSLSAVHSVVYPLHELYKKDSTKEEFIEEFSSAASGLFANTAMPVLFGIAIYSIANGLLSRVSMTLTPEILGLIVSLSLFIGLYTAEFSSYPDKDRSLFTSIMYVLMSDGMKIYEDNLDKYLLLTGLLFTYEGGTSPLRKWRSDSILTYKYNGKTLLAAFPNRELLNDWFFEATEVGSKCSFCGEFDGKCLEIDRRGFIVGSDVKDTHRYCICQDCHKDLLKAAVASDYMNEADILTHEI